MCLAGYREAIIRVQLVRLEQEEYINIVSIKCALGGDIKESSSEAIRATVLECSTLSDK